MSGAFPEVASEHLNVKVIAGRVSHAKKPMVALNLSKREAMGKVFIEVPAVGLVNRCCSLDRFIHASCPKTANETVRPEASTGPSRVNWVVVLLVTLN